MMNRKSLLLYLREVRDLELAKHKIETLLDQTNEQYQLQMDQLCNYGKSMRIPDAVSGWTGGKVLALAFCLFFLVGGIWGLTAPNVITVSTEYLGMDGRLIHGTEYVSLWKGARVLFWVFVLVVSLFLFGAICTIKSVIDDRNENRAQREDAIQHNQERELLIEQNKRKSVETQSSWKRITNAYSAEHNKVSNLPAKYYNQNILASQYRNLASVYYIYDYISTSRATLDETLIHEHMENGIQRILAKLDYIIGQNEEIIFQNRVTEAQNNFIIEQNKSALGLLNKIEDNTRNILENTEMIENYCEANAYFSAASYLRKP